MNRAFFFAALLALSCAAPSARADIFQWEFINPADPSQGKRQSTTLAPDGAGVDAVQGANFSYRNVTMAYLIGADLMNAHGEETNLTNADMSHANLANTNFTLATLTDADFTSAEVRGASFAQYPGGTGITLSQLYSTASYKAYDLSGIGLGGNNLPSGNFTAQNLTDANFSWAMLTGADFREANLTNVSFRYASLSGVNLAGQDLRRTAFTGATLTDANFTGVAVQGASFAKDFVLFESGGPSALVGSGITIQQIYSTASYQAHDLSGIDLLLNNLAGAYFAGQNLTNARLSYATLTDADFRLANLTNASFWGARLTRADFREADLTNVHFFINAVLTGANLSAQILSGKDFRGAALTDADFTGADVGSANFSIGYSYGTGITLAQLYSTSSYEAHDLSGINFTGNNLTDGNLVGQNLTNADFTAARLTGTDFTGADIRGASFVKPYFNGSFWIEGTGITLAQLYSTASYQSRDLSGVRLPSHDLSGAFFAGQNLTNADFQYAALYDADLTAADARGARLDLPASATTTNLIWPDGHIAGLNLAAGEKLVAYPGVPIPVYVSGGFSIAPTATFDLTNNDLIVRATAATKDALHAEVQAKIKGAHNGVDANGLTNWNGPGITSSSARATNLAAGLDHVGLGVIRNSDLDVTTGVPGSSYTTFSGQSVGPDDVLLKYTYIGDANLDGVINFDDYVGMDNAFFGLIPNLGWATGDVNFDGVINFDDYSKVDQAFFFQAAPLTASANGPAAIPEPGTLLLVAVSSLMLLAYAARRPKTIQK